MDRLRAFPLSTLLLAAALLWTACDDHHDDAAVAEDGTSGSVPVATSAEPQEAGAPAGDGAVEPAAAVHRIGLAVAMVGGDSKQSGEVEESEMLSIVDDSGGLGFRPTVTTLEGEAEPVVRVEVFELSPNGDELGEPAFARLFLKEGGTGAVDAPDGEGSFEVTVTSIAPAPAPAPPA